MRRRRWAARAARVLGLLALSCAGCGDDSGGSGPSACVPGQTQLCTGPGACDGAQFCAPDGERWSECDCGSAAATPLTPGMEAPGTSNVPNRLGATCETDADCGQGWLCWAATARDFLGFADGPAHGYCTLACSRPEDCQGVDPGAACNVADGREQGLCLRGCLSKTPEPRERKCLDRPDLTCWSLPALDIEPFSITTRQQGLCQPSCGSDQDCPEPLFCDLTSGLCTARAPSGAAIGAVCAVDSDCASGTCLSPLGGASYCSAPCRFGALGCGFPETAARPEAACAAPLLAQGGVAEGVGDVGTCLELCDVTDPCSSPEWQCVLAAGLPGGRGVCQFAGSVGAALPPGDAL